MNWIEEQVQGGLWKCLLGFLVERMAVCEKSQFNGLMSEDLNRRFMAYVACDATVFGSKQAPPGWIGLQSIPRPQA